MALTNKELEIKSSVLKAEIELLSRLLKKAQTLESLTAAIVEEIDRNGKEAIALSAEF